MDPTELLQTSTQIAKAGAAFGAAVPFTNLVKRMLGPAADEIAERVKDEIRIYRYGRQLSLLEKAESVARKAGFSPKAVPIKLLFPLLEGASLEENEDIHDMWASLLANASRPDDAVQVRPSFTETLRLMTPEVARFLDLIYQRASRYTVYSTEGWPKERGGEWLETNAREITKSGLSPRKLKLVNLGTYSDLEKIFNETMGAPPAELITNDSPSEKIAKDEATREAFAVIMDELTRFEMWSVITRNSSGKVHFYLSAYAALFMTACHVPQKPAPPEQ